MASPLLWTSLVGIQTAINSGLDSLATSGIATSSAIDNSSGRYIWGMAELAVTYGTNPTSGSNCAFYVIPSVDGTNYPDFTSGSEPSNLLYDFFPLVATTSAQRLAVPFFLVPPGLFKLGLKNNAGQTMAASGNTLKYNLFSREI